MIESRIAVINKSINGKDVECYSPEIHNGTGWISILDDKTHIIKITTNGKNVCGKCVGSGHKTYLGPTMELIIDSKIPCEECKGSGLRAVGPVDNIKIAENLLQVYIKKIEISLSLLRKLKYNI